MIVTDRPDLGVALWKLAPGERKTPAVIVNMDHPELMRPLGVFDAEDLDVHQAQALAADLNEAVAWTVREQTRRDRREAATDA